MLTSDTNCMTNADAGLCATWNVRSEDQKHDKVKAMWFRRHVLRCVKTRS